MEVAALAKPIVVGPHTDNFAMPVAYLLDAHAIRVVQDTEQLGAEIERICRDPAWARRLGESAREVVRRNQGATDRTADRLLQLVTRGGTGSSIECARSSPPTSVR
jgi:3-deoxy-D-manno-octulosonic-acid transferase